MNKCKKCHETYTERPAQSREDGSPICPRCGEYEAFMAYCKTHHYDGS